MLAICVDVKRCDVAEAEGEFDIWDVASGTRDDGTIDRGEDGKSAGNVEAMVCPGGFDDV